MVEGACLERMCAGNRTVGSNPTPSALSRRSFDEARLRQVYGEAKLAFALSASAKQAKIYSKVPSTNYTYSGVV